jgi:hypothetical protein
MAAPTAMQSVHISIEPMLIRNLRGVEGEAGKDFIRRPVMRRG